ncbi:hypothetical protein LQW54_001299 [Pestalotiopsis sp. IQ-011]
MRLAAILLVACAVLGVQAQLFKGTNGLPKDLRIMMTNSAGWYDYSIRFWFNTLLDRGYDVVLSAPAKDMTMNYQSKVGYGGRDEEPWTRLTPCQWHSCEPGQRWGSNETSFGRLNWVNSYPATALRFGLDRFGRFKWDHKLPDLVIAGPTDGPNIGAEVSFSGVVAQAALAANKYRIPAITFAWPGLGIMKWDPDRPIPPRMKTYLDLAQNLTELVVAGGRPFLPENTFLNVNFPPLGAPCNGTRAIQYVLTRRDLDDQGYHVYFDHCNTRRLPTDRELYQHLGCYASISVLSATHSKTAGASVLKIMRDRLSPLLTCVNWGP